MLDCPRHDVVTGRIRNLGLGALVSLAFAFAAAGAPVIGDVVRRFDFMPEVMTVLGSIAVFGVIYRYAPRSVLSWRASFIGAIPAGIAVQGIPALVGLYFDAAAGLAAVRIFLLLAVLLLGLYVMALTLLVGAGFAVKAEEHARDRDARLVPRPVAEPAAPVDEGVPVS
jgi:uncharacterized BrkB/YihY/UPF0761 family membrane protein